MAGDKVFDDVTLVGTGITESGTKISSGHLVGMVVYQNTHDQIVTLQLQGAMNADFTEGLCDVGASFNAPASMTQAAFQWMRTFFPFYRLEATPLVGPASGTINAWIVSGGIP